ncbi:unnamed protein product [Somion occarium]|uniref:Ribosomal protein S2 n=1 Tax=Somion occarium TaxID=3059160 RepID=A0ABP1CYL5_9APHY
MFRLPTHLETFIPPPREQVPQTRPWRGTLILPTSGSPSSAPQELRCTAAETEGDNQVDVWPTRFVVQTISQRPLLQEMQAWAKTNVPPICMFMPDRLSDQDTHRRNQANFETFATMLAENQFIAIAPWNLPDRLSGGGIIIFSTRASHSLLVGAVFLNSAFPDFLAGLVPPPARPTIGLPRALLYNNPSDRQTLPNIATSQRHSQSPTSSRASRFSG